MNFFFINRKIRMNFKFATTITIHMEQINNKKQIKNIIFTAFKIIIPSNNKINNKINMKY